MPFFAPHLRIALLIAVAFGASVTLIGWSIGAHLLVPNERVSIALGFSAVLPIVLGFFSYIGVILAARLTKQGQQNRAPLVQVAANDLSLLVIFVVVSYFHFNLKMWIPLINPTLWDAEFMASDEAFRWLVDGTMWISVQIHELWRAEVRIYQTLFLAMFILSFCNLAARRDAYYPQFAIGILLVLSLGCFSYLIMPALGPFIFEAGAQELSSGSQGRMYNAYQRVQEHGVEWVNRWGGEYFTGSLAAMPSLHVAHASVMTYYMFRSRAFLYPLFLIFWVWIFIESIALRWHYVIDDIAGLALAAIVIYLVHLMFSKPSRQRYDAAGEAASKRVAVQDAP
ncbi:MAG: phosphatase PAP2 family protein [Pseudomonadota bacterium]